MSSENFNRALVISMFAALVGCGGGADDPATAVVDDFSAEPSSSSSSSSSSGDVAQSPTFSVATIASAGGSIAPSSASVVEGGAAAFDLAAEAGYSIASVSGCGGVLEGTTYTTGAIGSSCAITAQFVRNNFNVSTLMTEGGSITPTSASVFENGTVSFALQADSGFSVSSVSGCGGVWDGSAYTTGAITAPCTVSAEFMRNSYKVDTSAGEGGSISPVSSEVYENSSTTFTINAYEGYGITSVSGCGGQQEGTTYTTGAITDSCTVAAKFGLRSYSVTAAASTGGSITPAQQTVSHGATASFTLTADAGFALASVTGCGGSISASTYTTAVVKRSCAVSAEFTPILYQVSAEVKGLSDVLSLAYNNGAAAQLLQVSSNGNIVLASDVSYGASYEVSVHEQPQGQLCAVSNGSGVVEADVSTIAVSCETVIAPARISGTITPSSAASVDSDLNDTTAAYADNSTPQAAQQLYHQATVHGFASAEATLGALEQERFAASTDTEDFYRVVLEAGQTVQLQVVDANGVEQGSRFDGDLDLYLFDANLNLAGASESATGYEEIIVPTSQEYLINIHAYSGVSKYVLRLLPAPITAESSTTAETVPEFVPNEMIVKYREQTSSADLQSQKPGARPGIINARGGKAPAKVDVSAAGVRPGKALQQLQQRNARAYEKVLTLRSIKKMRSRDDVLYAEPNYIRRSLLAPNDPHYHLQWHYPAIGLPAAWDITTGKGAERDVVVAVIDTGVVLAHPDMSGQLVGGYDFIANADRARDGDGIDANADDPGDSDTLGSSSWHGTHVAGTVAAASNNGTGLAGVAWGAKVMPLRVLGKDGGTSYDIIQAVRFAAGLPNDSGTVPAQPADIINMSFGGPSGSAAEQDIYAQVRATGAILVAAAGNSNSSSAFYPAAYPEVISVSATDYVNQKAPYSNYGATIAIAAPGGNSKADLNGDGYGDGILSTAADDGSGSIKPLYRFYNGTSMAAPHVAGVLALMKAVNPQLSPDAVDTLLQNGSITDDIGVQGRDDLYGYGLINAPKAVQAAIDLASGGTVEAQASVVADPGSLSLGFKATASFSLVNQGGGAVAVASLSTTDSWLSAAAVTTDAVGFGEYAVTITRDALASGIYSGEVHFLLSDGMVVVVPVTMQVDATSSAGELAPLYVLLIDAITGAVVDEVAVAGGTSASYVFEQVAAGDYRVVAGSDVDADNYVCTFGESCGKYPHFDSPQTISISGTDVTAIDFTAGVLNNLTTTVEAGYGVLRK